MIKLDFINTDQSNPLYAKSMLFPIAYIEGQFYDIVLLNPVSSVSLVN